MCELFLTSTENDFEKSINELDQQVTEILLLSAEKKCTKVSSHHLECWSPELVEAMKTERFWKAQLTKVSRLPYTIGLVKANEIYSNPVEQYNEAVQKYDNLRKKAKKIREDFLMDRGKDVTETKEIEAAKEMKSIVQTEKQRDQSPRFKTPVKNAVVVALVQSSSQQSQSTNVLLLNISTIMI